MIDIFDVIRYLHIRVLGIKEKFMVEKGFRLLQCSGCVLVLRITISEVHYGRSFFVKCPTCKTKTRTMIPVPPNLDEKVHNEKDQEHFFDYLKDIFGDFTKKPK